MGKANQKATAKGKIDDRNKLFDKFDTDKDGFLNRREGLKYAKATFDFTIPEAMYVEMTKYLVAEGQKGVPKASFHKLKVAVGIARDKVQDGERNKVREEKETDL